MLNQSAGRLAHTILPAKANKPNFHHDNVFTTLFMWIIFLGARLFFIWIAWKFSNNKYVLAWHLGRGLTVELIGWKKEELYTIVINHLHIKLMNVCSLFISIFTRWVNILNTLTIIGENFHAQDNKLKTGINFSLTISYVPQTLLSVSLSFSISILM